MILPAAEGAVGNLQSAISSRQIAECGLWSDNFPREIFLEVAGSEYYLRGIFFTLERSINKP